MNEKKWNIYGRTIQGTPFRFATVAKQLPVAAAEARPANFNPAVIFTNDQDLTNPPAGLITPLSGPYQLVQPLTNRPILPHSFGIQVWTQITNNPGFWNYFYPWQLRDAARSVLIDQTSRQLRWIDAINNPTAMYQSITDHYFYDQDFFIPNDYDNIISMPANYNQAGVYLPTNLVTNINGFSFGFVPPAGDIIVNRVFNYFELLDKE